jgi:type I restriction enzyme S subunit
LAALNSELEHVSQSPRHFVAESRWIVENDYRFDATTYAEEAFEALRSLDQCGYPKGYVGDLVGRVYHPTENQPRSNFKRIWADRANGVPFLTGKQLFYFRPDRDKFISIRMKKIAELRIDSGALLVSRSGSTGFPVLVSSWLSKFAITDDVLRVYPGKAPIGFVYAYLASPIGRPLLAKNEYGSTVSHLEAKHLKKVPIPLVDKATQQETHDSILEAYNLRDQANNKLDQAEELLYSTLGISPFSEADIEYFGAETEPRAFYHQRCRSWRQT